MTRQEDLLSRALMLVQQADTIVALTGAGISTPSGIPDFRSPTSGVWQNVDPMEVASIHAFQQNPRPFYQWLHPLAKLMQTAQPNAAHVALAEMEQQGRLKGIITQNIDLLHQQAGSTAVYEVHGNIRESTCMACRQKTLSETYMGDYIATGNVPLCPYCAGVLKLDVILFGEMLPLATLQKAHREAERCDLMIVAGSSLEVSPVNELPWQAKQAGANLIIVNFSETHLDYLADVIINADVVEILPQLAAAVMEVHKINW